MADIGVPPAPAPPVATGGPIGRPLRPGRSILLAIVTLGIYTFVWVYRQHEEMKRYSGDGLGGGLGVVLYLLVSPVTWFLIPSEIKSLYEAEGRESPVAASLGLWFLLPLVGAFIWYPKVQRALNDLWLAKGAPAP